jgi:creatinine amidohydrolase
MSTASRVTICAGVILALAIPMAPSQAQQRGGGQARGASPAQGGERRGGLNMDQPRPIRTFDTVWIEEQTWMETRDAIKAGKTTAIIPAGSTEQNGPYVANGKHVYVLRQTSEAIARKLGNALVAPTIPFEPGNYSPVPGTLQVRLETFEALVEDEANSLKTNGFKHIFLIGDSGGDQRGLENVARKLSAQWEGSDTTIHYIKEYYDSWNAADGSWASLGVPVPKGPDGKPVSDGIHDDYSVNSIIATLDPEKIRYQERVAAKKDTINGQPISPLQKTVENGRKLIEIRANITVEAMKKALGPSPR